MKDLEEADLILNTKIIRKCKFVISIYSDSKSAIDKCNQENTNIKMNRHLKVRHKSLRHKLKQNLIALNFVKSERNLADQLTKGLSRTVVLELSRGMGLSP